MFDLGHLSNEVGCFDQFLWRIATGDDNVEGRLTRTRRTNFIEYFIDREHAVAQNVNQFIEYKQVVFTARELLDAEVPGTARRLPILFGVFGVPGEAVAHGMDFDTQFFGGKVFAVIWPKRRYFAVTYYPGTDGEWPTESVEAGTDIEPVKAQVAAAYASKKC